MQAETVLLLVAHADDTEFFAGGTVAGFVAAGAGVHEVIATNNARGSFELGSVELVSASRDREAREAARILGKEEVRFLEYSDGMLGDVPVTELREKFIQAIRRVRPRIVMTFDPWAPFEPHPDHRAVAMAAAEALEFSHMPLFHPEHADEGFAPHLVAERYFFAKNPDRSNRFVDIAPTIDRKIEALKAHTSQMRMMIQDLRMGLEATGKHPEILPMLDPDACDAVIGQFIRMWASSVGSKKGLEMAEEFRYETAAQVLDQVFG